MPITILLFLTYLSSYDTNVEVFKFLQEDTRAQHRISLTATPMIFFRPGGEITAEFRILDKIGIAAYIGVGRFKAENEGDDDERIWLFDIGTQFRYYVIGSFIHGMQIGVNTGAVATRSDADGVTSRGRFLRFGPFAGYKITTNAGFTFDTQVGGEYMIGQTSELYLEETTQQPFEAVGFMPVVRAQIGWSF